jgi:hypothetical protein
MFSFVLFLIFFFLKQLDFMHCFNRTTTGVDAPRFAVPRAMKFALRDRKMWNEFKLMCAKSLLVLRRHSGLLVHLARYFFRRISKNSDEEIQRCLRQSLYLEKTDKEAMAAVFAEIELSVYSLKKYVKNTLHSFNLDRMTKK